MKRRFRNRTEAGQELAEKLTVYANRSDVIVLALPRGGVPVAFEVAKALNLPWDLCLVRKLGVPGQEELAMGAIGMGGIMVLNHEVVEWLNISEDAINTVAAQEGQELARRDRIYRGDRPIPNPYKRTIILVDDGIATGSTLRAAIATLQRQQPESIVVAVPVAPVSTCNQLKEDVEHVVCLATPEPFHAIGPWYDDFSQTTDEEVCNLLERASERQATKSR
jgi:putative phosphoribosyl transferase